MDPRTCCDNNFTLDDDPLTDEIMKLEMRNRFDVMCLEHAKFQMEVVPLSTWNPDSVPLDNNSSSQQEHAPEAAPSSIGISRGSEGVQDASGQRWGLEDLRRFSGDADRSMEGRALDALQRVANRILDEVVTGIVETTAHGRGGGGASGGSSRGGGVYRQGRGFPYWYANRSRKLKEGSK